MAELQAFFEAEWSATVPAWREHRAHFAAQTQAASALCLDLAGVAPGMRVLDLASGTGEPAFALAERVGCTGTVVATDLIAGPLQLLAEEAARRGLDHVRVVRAPLHALPFAASSFAAVTCRLGLMFAQDVSASLAEVRRVLRRGGRCAFVVWGDPLQPLFRDSLGVLDPGFATAVQGDEPGPFRFASAGRLTACMRAAGLCDVVEQEHTLPWPWPGDARSMWRAFVALAGPAFASRIAGASGAAGCDLNERVVAALRRHEQSSVTDPGARVLGVSGRCPG